METAGRVLSDLSTIIIMGMLVIYGIRVFMGHRRDEPKWRVGAGYLTASVTGFLGELFQHHQGVWLYFYAVVSVLWIVLAVWGGIDWWRERRDTRGTALVEEYEVHDEI